MAAEMEEGGGKTIEKETEYSLPILYSGNFTNNANVPGCLVYSADDLICLINNASIHILELQSTLHDISSQLHFSISLLPNRKDEAPFDVGIDPNIFCQQPNKFQESYSFGLDISLNPNRNNAIPCGYASAKWSPPNCSPNGSSFLATVTVNGNVHINGPERLTGKWKSLVNITGCLHTKLKANKYKETDSDKPGNKKIRRTNERLSKEFSVYKRRHYYLAMTGICWCPVVIEEMNSEPARKKTICNFAEKSIKNLLLATCNKLGWVFIWRIKVNLVTEKTEPYLEHTIKTGFEFATKISWYQDASFSIGYIAVAYSNGCIKICTVQLSAQDESFGCQDGQIYNLWNKKDLMAVKFMEWIRKDNQVMLVVTKMTDILLFTLNKNNEGCIVDHSYKLGPSEHHLPITALSCNGETIATAGMDGITQYFKVGDETSRACKVMCKRGYSCMGMQVSHKGLMMMQVLCPTAVVYNQGRYTKPMEAVIFPLVSMEEAAKRFADSNQPICFEMCEFLRMMANHRDIPTTLKEMCLQEVTCDASMNELRKLEFLNQLIHANERANLSSTSKEGEVNEEVVNFSLLKERLYRGQLEAALETFNDNRKIQEAEKEYLLLVADLLITKGHAVTSFEIAKSVYAKLNDNSSFERAKELWEKRKKDKIPSQSSSNRAGSSSDAEGSIENVCMPSREACPICKEDILLTNEDYGECTKFHHWKRCAFSLRILSDLQHRTCTSCGRNARCKSFDAVGLEWNMIMNVVNTDFCAFCNGKLNIPY